MAKTNYKYEKRQKEIAKKKKKEEKAKEKLLRKNEQPKTETENLDQPGNETPQGE